jgi:hypothetical protein
MDALKRMAPDRQQQPPQVHHEKRQQQPYRQRTQRDAGACLGKPIAKGHAPAACRERRKELYLENGDRWFELKRNGRPEWWVAREGMKFWTRQFMYTWPINVTDLDLQPGLIQNPGYEETY